MSEYDSVQRAALKLKGVSDHGIKKKKRKKHKKDKGDKKHLEQISSSSEASSSVEQTGGSGSSSSSSQPNWRDRRTAAELAFERANAKRSAELILKKASKTHKERIMDFNQHLDTLTEHFDIPKVSWTK